MKYLFLIVLFTTAACHTQPYDLWREQLGFDAYPKEGPFCGVAPDELSQTHAERLMLWCEGHTQRMREWCAGEGARPDWCKDPRGADQMRWFVRVPTEEQMQALAERRGWQRINATYQYVRWDKTYLVELAPWLFDNPGGAEAGSQHEWCHMQGEHHVGDEPFRVPEQCPVH